MFLLDTNVISELRKAGRGNASPEVVAWSKTKSSGSLYISAVTVFELEKGISAKERSDKNGGSLLRKWFHENVLKVFAGRILPVDQEVARICAAHHVPDPAPVWDSLIAATAEHFMMTLVTRNTKDFERFKVRLLNPWESHPDS